MKKILIDCAPWQTRIAVTDNEVLQNIYFYSSAQEALERAYFKGIVTKILPGIQTAFVDIGQEKAGFLHISEIDRELAMERIAQTIQLDDDEKQQRRRRRPSAPDISAILKEGESILVQVSKEPVYEKGAKLTTCFTLPGHFIVLMPNIPRIGVSKKVSNLEERILLKNMVRKHLPEGMGAIIRTTAEGVSEADIARDILFLVSTWDAIQKRLKAAEPREKIHADIDLALQVVRDHLDDSVESVLVNDKYKQQEVFQFIKKNTSEHSYKVLYYKEAAPLFERYEIERQIYAALAKKVELKSGGSLIIESTEAMTVIDVNTGKFIGKRNLEETIFRTNMEAAHEITRQLRLRNIGGLIVIDFIDMSEMANRQKLSHHFEKELKKHDKFQSVILKISEFGIVQMTRKRSGKTLVQQLTQTCDCCDGSGFINSVETKSFSILQNIRKSLASSKIEQITVSLHPSVFTYLNTKQYNSILALEKEFGCTITLLSVSSFDTAEYKIKKNDKLL